MKSYYDEDGSLDNLSMEYEQDEKYRSLSDCSSYIPASPEFFEQDSGSPTDADPESKNICRVKKTIVAKTMMFTSELLFSFYGFLCYVGVAFMFVLCWQRADKLLYENVQFYFPYTTSATMTICGLFCGFRNFVKKNPNKHRVLVKVVLCLSFLCALFCVSSLIYLFVVIRDSLNKLNSCNYDEDKQTCLCVGPNHKKFSFAQNLACTDVKNGLNSLAYAVGFLFGVGLIVSVLTTCSAGYLMRKERDDREKRVEERRRHRQRRYNHENNRIISTCVNSPSRPHRSMSIATQTDEKERPLSEERRRHRQPRYNDENNRIISTCVSSPSKPHRSMSIATQTDEKERPLSQVSSNSSEYSFEGISPPSYDDAIKSCTFVRR